MRTTLSIIFFFVISTLDVSAQKNQNSGKTAWFNPTKPAKTYCNPINIGYNYTTQNHNGIPISRRSSADPVIIPYKGDYYLFAGRMKILSVLCGNKIRLINLKGDIDSV